MPFADFLSKAEIECLNEAHKGFRERRQADRIKTILGLNAGYAYHQLEKLLLLDDSTLRRYFDDYKTGELTLLLEDNHKGSACKLDSRKLDYLATHLNEHVYCKAISIIQHLKEKFGITYTIRGVTTLLHRMDFVYKKMKHVPSKADPIAQKEFVKAYTALKRAKKERDHIYFMDSCHPMHQSIPAYAWIKKGFEKPLKANCGRSRINISAALDIEQKTVIWREDKTVNGSVTVSLLEQIRTQQPFGKIYMVADNAPYNHSNVVADYLTKYPRIKMLWLPPYSPNLNIIERLWGLLKEKVLYCTFYEKLKSFKQACFDFLDKLTTSYRVQTQSLFRDNFHILDG